ncbi:hypothetical protein MRX96_035727 [Rhipicephalus microplus]
MVRVLACSGSPSRQQKWREIRSGDMRGGGSRHFRRRQRQPAVTDLMGPPVAREESAATARRTHHGRALPTATYRIRTRCMCHGNRKPPCHLCATSCVQHARKASALSTEVTFGG